MATRIGLLVLLLAGCQPTATQVACVPDCAAGFHCSDGNCVADSVDDASVGDLPMGCAPACSGGTPHCNASGHCVACLADTDCPNGTYCNVISPTVASCVQGCMSDDRCGGGQKCCNKRCSDITSDAFNCGSCGNACSTNHAQATCSASACQAGACDTGWGDCNGDSKDGCETNLHVDPANCTMCGMGCSLPNANTLCSDGCYISSCTFGYDDCNVDPTDGCEAQVLTDVANCGACGATCNGLPNAKATCTDGNCVLGQCNVGFYNCDGDPKNGCEVATGTDVNNCGACGNKCGNGLVCVNGGCTCAKCNFANAASSCVNNVCVMGACVQGFADCNNNPNDGCEVNLLSDKNNCNGCGMACPNNLPNCGNGVCTAMPICVRVGWKTGNADWSCPNGYRMPTINEFNSVMPCITQQDNAMFGTMNDIAVDVGGCNCKWNMNWCGQPSIDTIRQGRMCGDFQQLQICLQ